MKAVEFLNQCLVLKNKINDCESEIKILRDGLFKVTTRLQEDKVKNSPEQDLLGSTMAEIVDLEHEVNILLCEYFEKFKEIKNVIYQVTDDKEFDLLHKKFIQGMSFNEIASQWKCSSRWVHEVKRDAYNSIEKILQFRENMLE